MMALQLVDALVDLIDGATSVKKSDDDMKITDLTQNMCWLNAPSDKSAIQIAPNMLSFGCDIETDFWFVYTSNIPLNYRSTPQYLKDYTGFESAQRTLLLY